MGTGCGKNGAGFQGGNIPTEFTGIQTAEAISPQTIRLTWNQYPGSTKYNVYSPDANSALAQVNFNVYLFKPVPLDSNKTYRYSVSAQDPSSGLEVGERTNYIPVKLLPHFNFTQDQGAISTQSKTSVLVSWNAQKNASYKVYLAERFPTGAVNYNAFVAASAIVDGKGAAPITGLLEGHEYCAIVVASYLDGTNDAPNGTLFTGDIGTTLNTNAYLKGPSGGFSDSIIAKSQKCVRTQSDFDVSSVKVYAQKATLSNQPTFFVFDPTDSSSNNQGNLVTQIYQRNEATGLSSLIGQTIGTGLITALNPIPSGRYKFFAVATDNHVPGATNKAQAIIFTTVGTPNSPPSVGSTPGITPTSESGEQWVYVRSFDANEDPAKPLGYFPNKQQGGNGSQAEGSAIAVGDFNCDGKVDIAVGIPNASVMAADNRPAQQGKVVVYYDISNGTPNTLPPLGSTRAQEITFDITSQARDPSGDNGRNLRLGTKLYVGNFNKDTQLSNQFGIPPQQSSTFRCDDLAIGSGLGPLFVLYGKRNVVGNDGGLNYVNSTSFTFNPSSSCDPSSNVCQPTAYSASDLFDATKASKTVIGFAITSGDYNGDDYEDLALTTNVGTSPRGVWVLRGSEYGLITPNSYVAAAGDDHISTTPGPYAGFPFIPLTPVKTYTSGGVTSNIMSLPLPVKTVPTGPNPNGNWAGTGFGSSAGTFHNAFYDWDGSSRGTKRMRDILMIGDSANGVVFACIPRTDNDLAVTPTASFTSDANENLVWDCGTRQILAPSGASSGFGTAIAGIKNALLYRPDSFGNPGTSPPCDYGSANCSETSTYLGYPGALAISATGSSRVYIYYGVARPDSASFTRDTMGIARNTYFANVIATPSPSPAPASTTPCSVDGSGAESCKVQYLTPPSTSSGYGSLIFSLPGDVDHTSGAGISPFVAKDTNLAVVSTTKGFQSTGGISYTNVGSVQLYKQNSRFANNPIVVKDSGVQDDPCKSATNAVCRYSDGFSNSLTTALDYDGPDASNVDFGSGGVAAGPVEAAPGGQNYSPYSDIFIGAPGFILQTTNLGNPVKVVDSGAVFSYFSHAGTYRNYRTVESGPTASPWHIMSKSFAQESDYKFHQAISIGDINQDKLGDVAVRINRGTQNVIRIYSGSSKVAGKVALDTDSTSIVNFQVQADPTGGKRFIPAGKVGTGQFPLFFVTGQNTSYLFSSGIGGLIQGIPTAFGIGGTPRKFSYPGGDYLNLADSVFYNGETLGNIDSTLNAYTPFAHGDFNGDGYEDFAMGVKTNITYTDADVPATTYGTGSGSNGRVLIFYGGAIEGNAFQTQPDNSGYYPLTSARFTDYSADAPTSRPAPCSTFGTDCKIQILHENNTTTFGSTLAAVPVGNCLKNGLPVPVHALLVTLHRASGALSDVYVYKPACLGVTGKPLSGLISYTPGSAPEKLPTPVPPTAGFSSTFGLAMTSVTGLMGPNTPTGPPKVLGHVVVSDQSATKLYVFPIKEIDVESSSGRNIGTAEETGNGGRIINFANSAMVGSLSGSQIGFGNGISSAGDLNGDGFGDFVVGMTSLPRRDLAKQVSTQGAALVIFGGTDGAQVYNNGTTLIEPSRNASCYLNPTSGLRSVCNPQLIYLPTAYPTSVRDGAFERVFVSPNASVSCDKVNENLGSILIGTPGRDSLDTDPLQRILQGGAFYELP